MNKELLGYEDAVKEIKRLENRQRYHKKNRKAKHHFLIRDLRDSNYLLRKKEIKVLLSLIAAHKQARKFYSILRDIKKDVGMSSDAYKRLSSVISD